MSEQVPLLPLTPDQVLPANATGPVLSAQVLNDLKQLVIAHIAEHDPADLSEGKSLTLSGLVYRMGESFVVGPTDLGAWVVLHSNKVSGGVDVFRIPAQPTTPVRTEVIQEG